MSNDAFELKDKGLKDLIRILNESSPYAKVGIIGSSKHAERHVVESTEAGYAKKKVKLAGSTHHIKAERTNAEIGADHEFGTDKLPQRSFLRIPITEQMQKFLDKSGYFNKDSLRLVLSEKSLISFVKKIGVIGESIVLEAFNTGGFGKWQASNMKNKKTKQTLIETQQLVRSIASEVKEK